MKHLVSGRANRPQRSIRRRARLGAGLLAAAALLACGPRGPDPAPSSDPATRRSLSSGSVVGYATTWGAHAWRGIPFARPPVGERRWRAPRPPEPWQGDLEALDFGPACPQFAGPMGARDGTSEGEPSGDEDCLRLHVYAPPFEPGSVPGEGDMSASSRMGSRSVKTPPGGAWKRPN